MREPIFLNFCFLLFLQYSVGMYYILGHGNSKCLTFEQPKDTPIVFEYKIMDSGHTVLFNIFYGSSPKEEFRAMSKTLVNPSGHVDFTTDNDGGYCVCTIAASENEGVTRFELAIKYGYDAEYYTALAKEQSFDALNLEIHKLNDLMTMITHESDYQKHKELSYHKATERMNNAIIWWPLLQISILVLTGIFQVQHLKSFFKNTQLI